MFSFAKTLEEKKEDRRRSNPVNNRPDNVYTTVWLEDMIIKYNAKFDKKAICKNIDRLTNQIFKLLPIREEGGDWQTPLENIIIEIVGMNSILLDQVDLFSLICRLEGLKGLELEEEFFLFRKNIFECLNLLSGLKSCLD